MYRTRRTFRSSPQSSSLSACQLLFALSPHSFHSYKATLYRISHSQLQILHQQFHESRSLSLSLSLHLFHCLIRQFSCLMESAAALRSFHCSAGIFSQIWSSHERPGKSTWSSYQSHIQGLAVGKLASSTRRAQILVSCSKTTGMILSSKSADGSPKGSMEKHTLQCTTFPDIFEALVLEVCDETSVAEVKLKVGNFEMHLKRNIGATNAPIPVSSPTIAPPVPTDPMIQSANSAPSSSTPKSSPEKVNSFVNPLSAKSTKLASLEASGSSGYKLVSSPTVGSFRKGRTVKGNKQPPICKQGDVVKEGQIIGYVDQFGTELPIKSDVDGEILKILFDEGEPVGYGDPLVAVLPSFHGIQ